MKTLLTLVVLAGLWGSAVAQVPDPVRLERLLRPGVRVLGQPDTAYQLLDRMRSYRVPGLSLAVIDNWRIVLARGYGVTEFGGSVAVDTATLFQAGSISKPVFASGLMRLVAEGKLALDEDVNRKLTSWQLPASRFTETEKVTLRRLLSHTAGLTIWGFPGYSISGPVPTVAQVLDGAPPANTQAVRNDTTPGARWLYSGGGITIAQLITTDVTGESFPALMRRLVLDPAGMIHSTYENPPPAERVRKTAAGHEQLDTPVTGRFHVYPEMAAAGLWTTASDLARWAIALSRSYLDQPGGFVPPAAAREMLTVQVRQQPPYGTGQWGLGVALRSEGDSLQFFHGGRDEGFVASLVMWPRLGRGLVIMMNGVQGGLMQEVARGFQELYGLPAAARPEKRLAAADPGSLDAAAGRYRALSSPTDTSYWTVSRAGNELRILMPLGRVLRVLPQGKDSYFDLDNGFDWSFERDATGAVVRLVRSQGSNRLVIQRVPSGGGAR